MEYKVIEDKVLSTDKIHNLYGKIYVPKGDIKGIFQVVHGMTEHIDRYDKFMSYICSQGYLVFGFNHIGHKNTSDDNTLGYIAKKDGWKILVDDVGLTSKYIKEKFGPNLPFILMGHSMGSFIVRIASIKYREQIDKLIIMGTGGPNPVVGLGIFLSKINKLFYGEKHISKFIDGMAFGSYNNKTEKKTPYDWLTTNEEIVDIYSKDKYCTFKFTISAYIDLFNLTKQSNSNYFFKNIDKKLPILLVSGDEDPVGTYSKGTDAVYNKLSNNGCDIKYTLYKGCRHEILNDKLYTQVYEDISEFIK